eukprot:2328482-Rhodomonas_salina.4
MCVCVSGAYTGQTITVRLVGAEAPSVPWESTSTSSYLALPTASMLHKGGKSTSSSAGKKLIHFTEAPRSGVVPRGTSCHVLGEYCAFGGDRFRGKRQRRLLDMRIPIWPTSISYLAGSNIRHALR